MNSRTWRRIIGAPVRVWYHSMSKEDVTEMYKPQTGSIFHCTVRTITRSPYKLQHIYQYILYRNMYFWFSLLKIRNKVQQNTHCGNTSRLYVITNDL